MKNRQGIVWAPILIILATILVAGISGYFLYTAGKSNNSENQNVAVVNLANSNANTNSATNTNQVVNNNANVNTNTTANTNTVSNTNTTTDPTAGWKTYTSQQGGYSVQYPPSWNVSSIQPKSWILQNFTSGAGIGGLDDGKIKADFSIYSLASFEGTSGPAPLTCEISEGETLVTCNDVVINGRTFKRKVVDASIEGSARFIGLQTQVGSDIYGVNGIAPTGSNQATALSTLDQVFATISINP